MDFLYTDARFDEEIAAVPNFDRENAIRRGLAAGIPDSLPEDPSMSFGRAEAFDHVAFNAINRNVRAPVEQQGLDFGAAVGGVLDVAGDGRGDLFFGQPRLDKERFREFTGIVSLWKLAWTFTKKRRARRSTWSKRDADGAAGSNGG